MCEADHSTNKCQQWRDVNNSKLELLSTATALPDKLCLRCLNTGHTYHDCKVKEVLECPCGSGLSQYLCCKTDDCKNRKNWTKTTKNNLASTVSNTSAINGANIGATLNPIMMVMVYEANAKLRVMFDNCSQSTFIREDLAKKLKLHGSPISFILVCTDGSEAKKVGMKYTVTCLLYTSDAADE